MKSSFHAHALTVLLLSSFSYADTPLIRTTVADSSRVAFIAQTPLCWETIENHTTSLGKLNNTTYADVLFSAAGVLYAFDNEGYQLFTLNFPLTLPDGITATGGFAIGDLDRDEKVEIAFGTSDGCLHCWELGSSSTGYAPWTQFKHDPRRSGVLE